MNWGISFRLRFKSKQFGRIATQNAKNVILQKIREEERKVLYDEYYPERKRRGYRCGTAVHGKKCQCESG